MYYVFVGIKVKLGSTCVSSNGFIKHVIIKN
jgi:hypothetical protein